MSSSKPVLGYWDIRGLGQPIRLFLTYLGVDFEDKRYQWGETLEDDNQWKREKFTLELDFPNIPYLIDGNLKLTHHHAILRYIAEKYQKDLKLSVEEDAIVTMAQEQGRDMTFAWGFVAWGMDKDKDSYINTRLPQSLEQVSNFLDRQGPFVLGNRVTYADFSLYEALVKPKVMVPEVWAKYPKLEQYVQRIEALPRVAEYLKSHKPLDFTIPFIEFNGKY